MNDSEPTVEPDTSAPTPVETAAVRTCSQCGAARVELSAYCGDCGWIFEATDLTATSVPDGVLAGRYRLKSLIGEREGVSRFHGEDVGTGGDPIPVIVVRQAVPAPSSEPPSEPKEELSSSYEFDLPPSVEQPTLQMSDSEKSNGWPGVAWEQGILLRAAHLSLPRLIDTFTEEEVTYLIEEVPAGTPLWDAWDRDGVTNKERFGWLIQLAEAIERLHFAGAIVEGLRPEMVVVSPSGIAILADLSELLPLPLPGDVPLKGTFSTAPELLLLPEEADERADLYAFGALLYALSLGRELSDLDFTLTGMPRPYLERVPDANPYLARVLAKTFVRDPRERFPTDDGSQTDPTGFRELIAALETCRRNLDRVKLDIACWSTIGIVRSGNEDAVSIHHTAEGRLDDSDEAALILLADGMGGMESGEVAAALALATLRECLLSAPPFQPMLPVTPLPDPPIPDTMDGELPGDHQFIEALPPTPPPSDCEKESAERSSDTHAARVAAALREANRRVFETARENPSARGMGCTAEVVVIDGGMAVVGHVGDSRVYRMRRGKLTQVTRDHTLVSRLIEFGQITEKEAETHPRRSELQQAIGGRPEVYPDVYGVTLEPGDWIVVCSDGLSNQVSLETLQAVLRDAKNAERAARRLVNMVLADGAQDNVSVAVVRAA